MDSTLLSTLEQYRAEKARREAEKAQKEQEAISAQRAAQREKLEYTIRLCGLSPSAFEFGWIVGSSFDSPSVAHASMPVEVNEMPASLVFSHLRGNTVDLHLLGVWEHEVEMPYKSDGLVQLAVYQEIHTDKTTEQRAKDLLGELFDAASTDAKREQHKGFIANARFEAAKPAFEGHIADMTDVDQVRQLQQRILEGHPDIGGINKKWLDDRIERRVGELNNERFGGELREMVQALEMTWEDLEAVDDRRAARDNAADRFIEGKNPAKWQVQAMEARLIEFLSQTLPYRIRHVGWALEAVVNAYLVRFDLEARLAAERAHGELEQARNPWQPCKLYKVWYSTPGTNKAGESDPTTTQVWSLNLALDLQGRPNGEWLIVRRGVVTPTYLPTAFKMEAHLFPTAESAKFCEAFRTGYFASDPRDDGESSLKVVYPIEGAKPI